jgi:lipopolysaccharide biosynthesis protein
VPATQAHLSALKAVAPNLEGEVCFFVSFAARAELKPHVRVHIEHLLRAGVQVVLVLNTELPPERFDLDPELVARLSGVYVRANSGFDFAAWAHLYAVCESQMPRWSRLYLVNDSIVGPLNTPDFERLLQRLRASSADLVGLTESQSPLRHVQSFFLVFNATALRHPAVQRVFHRMLSLPTKGQVIDVYETRLTQRLTGEGLRCEALFAPLADDPHSANDTAYRWARLARSGFPYIKASILQSEAGNAQLKALVPSELLPPNP